MIRTITIIERRGTYDLPVFLLTENEVLTLKFAGLDPRLGRYVVTLQHGDERKTVYLTANLTVDITPEWLSKNGTKPLEAFLELRDNAGTKILIPSAKSATVRNGYYIEPLKIEKVDKSFSMVGWLQKIEKDLSDLKSGFEQELGKVTARVATVEEKLSEYEEHGVPLKFD